MTALAWLLVAGLAWLNLLALPAGSANIVSAVFTYVGVFLGLSLLLASAISRWVDKKMPGPK